MDAQTTPNPTIRVQIGDLIGETFIVERKLGSGGMGEVFLARDPRLDRLVAVKLLHPPDAHNGSAAARDEDFARFRLEARALSRIVHPNVVGIHAFGRHQPPQRRGESDDQATWYIAMEYVDGQTLADRLREGPIATAEALAIARQVAHGLHEAHLLGIVHRDVKPANVLLRTLLSGGQIAKVCDFGVAQYAEGQQGAIVTHDDTVLGTPTYMAPEQIRGLAVDGRTDLYAVGVVLFQMLAGQPPFRRDTVHALLMAHLQEEPPPLPQSVPPQVERALRKALAKRPQDRHQTLPDFVDALDAALNPQTVPQKAPTTPCPGCAHSVAEGQSFCGRCGSAVPAAVCPTCQTKRDGEHVRCRACGSSLVAGIGHADGVGARPAPVVILVACPAIAPVADHSNANAAADGEFAATFATAVAREGGRTLAFVGSEAIALWGLGGMADDDVAAAVGAALALSTPERPVRAAVEVGLVASLGVGVSWGSALLGGEAVERVRAAVLTCAPGEVAVGRRALHDVRGQFDVQLRPQTKQHIVLRRRSAGLALADYTARAVGRPLLGRALELEQLLRAAKKTQRDGSVVALALRGEADIGKSRLCGELLRHLQTVQGGWRLHVVRCGGGDAASSWPGLGNLLRALLPPGPDAELELRLRASPSLSDGDAMQLQRRVQALSRMLGLTVAPTAAAEPTTDAEMHVAFEAWAALVRGVCKEAPMVWVVEGLEHARPAVLSWLGHIARHTEGVPLLLLVPLRETRSDPVLTALKLPPTRLQSLALEPLQPDDVQSLVGELLDGFELPQSLLHAVVHFAEGLPGRVEQAIDALTDESIVQTNAQGWTVQNSQQGVALLESSMSDLLLRRVSRLPLPQRMLLDALALAGGPAPWGMLQAMLGHDAQEHDLTGLQQAGLLVVTLAQGYAERDVALRLSHLLPLLQGGIAPAQRVQLHRRASAWLIASAERAVCAQLPRWGALLAWHHQQAGDAEQAAAQFLRNAQSALAAFATRAAFEAFVAAGDSAATWLEEKPNAAHARQARMEALVGIAQTGMRCGELPAALQATVQAIAFANNDAHLGRLRVRAKRLRGHVLDSMGKPEEAIAALRHAVDDARTQPDGFAASIMAISLIVMVLQRQGRMAESVLIAEEALAQCADAEETVDTELWAGIGRLRGWLGHAASEARQFDTARAAYRLAQSAFGRCSDAAGTAMLDLSLGNVAYREGDLPEAERIYRLAAATCRALDDGAGEATAEVNLGNALLDQGRHEEALAALQCSQSTQLRMGRVENLPETLRLLALAHQAGGQRDLARKVAQEALAVAERAGQTRLVRAVKDLMARLGDKN